VSSYSLSPSDVADQLGVHVDTVKRWADSGLLPFMRTPGKWRRFRQEDVDAFIASQQVEPKATA
jgi:excisionase family DNA binding protein